MMKAQIKNRIISSGEANPQELKENPKNWRKHPKRQRDALEGILKQVGWVQDVIVNKRTGNLVDGHLRLSLALSKKEKSIPVKYVDLSEEEEALILSTIDPLAALAETDKLSLYNLLEEVRTDEAAVQEMLSSLSEKQKLIDGLEKQIEPENFNSSPYSEGLPEEKDGEEKIEGITRSVQLFMSQEQSEMFKNAYEILKKRYDESYNLTEVVIEGLKYASEN